jgi:O-antigen/teichoic acid export membrane protein
LIRHAPIPIYFAFRIASALILLKLSTHFLPVKDFANFAQFLAFASLLNMAVIGGAQNGLIRQAAAAADDKQLADAHGAGLAIWLAAIPILAIPIALLSRPISHVLTGSTDYWRVVIALGALSLAAGPGQIGWSLLSGRQKVAESLGAQTFGLVLGTALSAWFIVGGDFVAAALAFAAGPLVSTLAAVPFVARLHLRWRPTTKGVRPLLGYSAAMASTLGFTAITLFGLRYEYREQFGATQLGYWLAANRISDMSTQLLGLFMLQAFVPQLAGVQEPSQRTRLIVRYGAVAGALTGTALAVFLAAGTPLVKLFLSSAYLPAIPGIRLYMLGDFLRVWASLAMYAAFAAGRPGRYAAIEIGTVAVMAVVTLLLIAAGERWAPQIAYAAAYGLTAVVLAVGMLQRSGLLHRLSSRPRAARRILRAGNATQPH